jgi:hypothetical protein
LVVAPRARAYCRRGRTLTRSLNGSHRFRAEVLKRSATFSRRQTISALSRAGNLSPSSWEGRVIRSVTARPSNACCPMTRLSQNSRFGRRRTSSSNSRFGRDGCAGQPAHDAPSSRGASATKQSSFGCCHSGARRSREPGIHTHDRGYGFRTAACRGFRNDETTGSPRLSLAMTRWH